MQVLSNLFILGSLQRDEGGVQVVIFLLVYRGQKSEKIMIFHQNDIH